MKFMKDFGNKEGIEIAGFIIYVNPILYSSQLFQATATVAISW